jgi:two-component system, NarL family, invasion response regulator UvrY
VKEGNYYCCEQVREFMNDKPVYTEGKEIGSLTNREIEVALLIKDGFTSKEIANQLYLSPKTINIHRNNIFKKLNVKSTAAMLSVLRYFGS